MTLTAERFAQGLTYEDFKAQMTRNRERMEDNERTVSLSEADIEVFKHLPAPLNVLVLAEDWCGDVINNLPVLARLAEESGTLHVRVFPRDQHLDLMDMYLKDGQHRSIPVFAFFDQEFTPVGHWIERPKAISDLMERLRADLFATDSLFAGIAPDTAIAQLPEATRERLMEAFQAFRLEHRALADREVVRELRELLTGDGRVIRTDDTPAVVEPRNTTMLPGTRPVKVSITYCAACGYEPQTLELTSALMQTFQYDLAGIELIPWHDGAFEVVIGNDLVHSMYRDGGFPATDAIIAAVRERLTALNAG